MLCLYDNHVYKCGPKDNKIIEISSTQDIDQLNALQYLTSDHSLFCSPGFALSYFERIVHTYQHRRNKTGPISKAYRQGTFPNGNPNYYVFNSFTTPHIRLQLSFFKTLKKAKDIRLSNGLPIPRDASFIALQRLQDR